MKKVKRIMALAGVILLIGLYVTTLVIAIVDHSNSLSLLKASIFATFIIPVLIWAYTFIYKLTRGNKDDMTDNNDKKETSN